MKKAALAATLAAAVAAGTLAAAAEARTETSPGPAARIGIHGEWTIAIRTRRGRLVRRVRFHNDFVGQDALAGLLSYQTSLGGWAIELGGSSGGGPCDGKSKGGTVPRSPCWIVDPKHNVVPSGIGAFGTFDTLTVETAPSQVVLHGTATAGGSNSQIAVVTTELGTCPFGTTCNTGSAHQFTLRKLDPSAWIAVSAGQTIDVTVTLTLSNVP